MRSDLILFGLALALLGLSTLAAHSLLQVELVGVDDANIFLTYGRNLAAGEGFVYHPGGERVEGVTSFLWTFVCAGALLATSRPESWLLGSSVALAAAAAAAAASYARRDLVDREIPGATHSAPLFGLFTLLWCVATPAFPTWTTLSLMDTGLYSAVLSLGTVATARAVAAGGRGARGVPWGVCLALVALLLTRPEGMALGLAWVVGLWVGTLCAARDRRLAARRAAGPALVYLGLGAGLTTFRLAYFGFPLPNTFYAKVSPSLSYNLSEGFTYLTRFGAAQPAAALSAGLALFALLRFSGPVLRTSGPGRAAERWRNAALVLPCGVVLLGLAIPASLGGDHFVLFRALQPVWPLLALPLLTVASRPLTRLAGRAPAAVALGLLLVLSLVATSGRPRWSELASAARLSNEFAVAAWGRELGRDLNRLQPEAPRVSVGVAVTGGVGYTYRGEIVDLLGLNNTRMGHSPGERRGIKNHAAFHTETFFELAPDLLFPTSTTRPNPIPLLRMLRPDSFENHVTRGLLLSERFRRTYLPVLLSREEEQASLFVSGWCSRDAVEHLRRNGIRVEPVEAANRGAGRR